MVRIAIAYRDALRCEAVHEPSGTALVTDAPLDNHGRGESFSPTDLVATALGTCMMTVMGIKAEAMGIDLGAMSMEVDKKMQSAPRRIARLGVLLRMPARVSAEDRVSLERAALACPVYKSLLPEIDKDVTFEWGAG